MGETYLHTPFMKKVLHITERKRKTDIQHYCKSNDLCLLSATHLDNLNGDTHAACSLTLALSPRQQNRIRRDNR